MDTVWWNVFCGSRQVYLMALFLLRLHPAKCKVTVYSVIYCIVRTDNMQKLMRVLASNCTCQQQQPIEIHMLDA